jgi:NTE family protein
MFFLRFSGREMLTTTVRIAYLAATGVLISACATAPVPGNQPIEAVDEDSGYRRLSTERMASAGDSLIILSFSGGGTRAAALSYGVMQELRDTLIIENGIETRALDVVDSISSVSGGSFTAAYYGAFRDQLFETYEDDFLRRGVQSSLVTKLLRPVNWLRALKPGTDRTEMAVSYYDDAIFRGATFKDIRRQGPPYIEINATDLVSGTRFSFSQERFDLICSDLDSFPLARAVTASSAVPGVFPTVVLENHADRCDLSGTREWALMIEAIRAATGETEAYVGSVLESYRDVDRNPYIHLVDGGISDNLGLRAMTDRFERIGDYQFATLGQRLPRNIVIILVNAEVSREREIQQSSKSPSATTTMAALSNAQMRRRNRNTMDSLNAAIDEFRQRTAESDISSDIYFTEVSFDKIQDVEVSRYLNSLPTSLELSTEQVDRLIAAGRLLLRDDPSFRLYKEKNGGRLDAGAVRSDEICQIAGYESCIH